jgi:8-oxo-dGTP pyrophosphatase MutT (NUDIX family)
VSWLEGYVPKSEGERADVARVALELLGHGAVWARSTPLHVTGSALVVHPPTQRVLLRWHERYGIWNHVGGHANDDERDPWVTALREAQEETGLRDLRPFPGPEPAIVFIGIVPVPAGRGEADHEHADVNYLLATDSPDAIADEHADAELRWLPLDMAPTMVNPCRCFARSSKGHTVIAARLTMNQPQTSGWFATAASVDIRQLHALLRRSRKGAPCSHRPRSRH